jgi:hypothetical protein
VVRGGILFSIGDEDGDQGAHDVMPNDEDHATHQLFCEMDELQVHDSSQYPEWKEAARWVKFEEDVENCGRWSKPHVATLSLHSLFELRSCIFNGTVLLNLNCDDMDKIAGEYFDGQMIGHLHSFGIQNAIVIFFFFKTLYWKKPQKPSKWIQT